jgi:macrolide-specific efflux system membrane fusion protein
MLIRFVLAILGVLGSACRLAGGEANLPSQSAPAPAIRLSHCLVSLIDDVEVPAEKPGVLTALSVKEGDYLEQGAAIGLIDDRQAREQHTAAKADHAAAKARAESELETEYAVATHRTAEAEYQIALTANAKQPNTVAAVEVERLRLTAEQARIKIGVTQFERGVRGIEADGFAAKANLAETDLSRHRLAAPIAGEVVEIYFRAGEWVEPGKPVVHLVRLDRLRIEGFVRFEDRAPGEVLNRAVRATITIAGGKTETFEGTVTFVSPIIQPGGEYRIWAEVENRRVGTQWLLRPGLEAELELRTKY